MPAAAHQSLLFVCEDNFVRSPLAAAICGHALAAAGRAQPYRIGSAGSFVGTLSRPVEPHILQLATIRGLDLSSHRTTQLSAAMVADAAAIVALDTSSFWEAQGLAEEQPHKVSMLTSYGNVIAAQDIPNPLYGEIGFEELVPVLEDLVERLLRTLPGAIR